MSWFSRFFRGDRAAGNGTPTRLKSGEEATISKRTARADGAAAETRAKKIAAPDLTALRTGDVIADAYEVRDAMAGGMGVVYIAWHLTWQMDMAVKVPLPALYADDEGRRRFVQEAEAWTDLGLHPNITYCYYVEPVDKVPLLVVEYIDGGNLRSWITSRTEADCRAILDIAIQACHGLEHAHAQGKIHRDVKPENILLTQEGIAKLTDFGIVRMGDRDSTANLAADLDLAVANPLMTQLTCVGTMGTPAYMAPEQWHDTHTVDERCDLFSLGVCLYEMLCGARPFEIAVGPRQAMPTPGRALPESLVALLETLLDWDPARRPASAKVMREALAAIYVEQFGTASPYAGLPPLSWIADGWNNRGASYYYLNKHREAEDAWAQALDADPLHAEGVYNTGVTQWRAGEYTDHDFLAKLASATAANPDEPRLHYCLGLAHLELHDFEAARHSLLWAKRLGSDDARTDAALAEIPVAQDGIHSLQQMGGNFEQVKAIGTIASGRIAVSTSIVGSDRLWDLESGKCIRILGEKQSKLNSAAISTDGRFVLGGRANGNVHRWDLRSNGPPSTMNGHQGEVKAVAMAGDGRTAVSGGKDRTLRLWDLDSERCLHTMTGHAGTIYGVAVSRNGNLAVSASADNTLRLWDLASGTCVNTLEEHSDAVMAVALTADDRFAVSCSNDDTLRVWSLGDGRCVRVLRKHYDYVETFAVTPSDRFVAYRARGAVVQLWPLPIRRTAVAPVILSRPRSGSDIAVDAHSVGRLAEEAQAALDAEDGATAYARVRQAMAVPGHERDSSLNGIRTQAGQLGWRSTISVAWEKQICSGHETWVSDVKISDDGRVAVSLSTGDKTLRVWDLVEGGCRHVLAGHQKHVGQMALTADGRFAISGSVDETALVWDLETGQCRHRLEGHDGSVTALALTSDDRFVISGSSDKTLRVWELSSGRCVRTMKGHDDLVGAITVTADSRLVLSAGWDKTLRLWSLADGRCLHTFSGHGARVDEIAVSIDGRLALSGGLDETVRVWDLTTGRCLHSLEGHTSAIQVVAFTNDSRFAVTAAIERALRVWDLLTGSCVQMLEMPPLTTNVAVTGDGRFAVSGTAANVSSPLKIWDLASGRCVQEVLGHTKDVEAVAVMPDGRYVVSASCDNTVRLWELVSDYEFPEPANWDERARPYLENFLVKRSANSADGSTSSGAPAWSKDDFADLIRQLQWAGYGWLRPEGVSEELDGMVAKWNGPPQLPEIPEHVEQVVPPALHPNERKPKTPKKRIVDVNYLADVTPRVPNLQDELQRHLFGKGNDQSARRKK